MNPQHLLEQYCAGQPQLLALLLRHSRDVAQLACYCAECHPELRLDASFIYEAAMLHDIGVVYTHAPNIHCNGKHPYLLHGMLGGNILRREGLPRHARVAERHTGTGLTAAVIAQRGLPMPAIDWVPQTLEEQLVCYADKFFSKSRPQRAKTLDEVQHSLAKFGTDCVAQFMAWHKLFGLQNT